MHSEGGVPALPWQLEDIDFASIDPIVAARNEDLIVLLCASSFVESGSDLYSNNLALYFEGDKQVQAWLDSHWEPEELQHGRALRAYIARVWPDFDWHKAFTAFFAEYAKTCSVEDFEKTRGLELAARCVVETGTATLYRAISESTDEPILRTLTSNIRIDEVRHYKYFLKHFHLYNRFEKNGRFAVLGALIRRLREIKSEDSNIALRHVYKARFNRDPGLDSTHFKAMSDRVNHLVKRHLSADMCLKMLMKPLNLPARLQSVLLYPISKIAQTIFFR